MRRRAGRPGLLGTMARTAVIAGTATAVSGSVQQKQQAGAERAQAAADQEAQSQAEMAAMQAQLAELQQQPPPAAAPAQAAPQDAAPAGGDLLGQLERLSQLKSAGALSDVEFSAAKAKLLGL